MKNKFKVSIALICSGIAVQTTQQALVNCDKQVSASADDELLKESVTALLVQMAKDEKSVDLMLPGICGGDGGGIG